LKEEVKSRPNRLFLELSVAYKPGTISYKVAKACITGALEYAINNGMLSGETAAEVEDYNYRIHGIWAQQKKE
jgi:hypothetical protein